MFVTNRIHLSQKKAMNVSKPSEHVKMFRVGTLAVETKALHGIKRVPQCSYIDRVNSTLIAM